MGGDVSSTFIFKGFGFGPDSIARRLQRAVKVFLAALLLCGSLTGCVPSGETDVNTELFKDREDMEQRAQSLKAGMAKKTVFERLGIEQNRFSRMGSSEVQTSVYGNSQVQGTPDQLEQFRTKLSQYEGYSLPYREIKSSRSLGFGMMKTQKTGHDLKLVLIFDRDRLIKAQIEGTDQVNLNEDQYIWDFLLSRGAGMAF